MRIFKLVPRAFLHRREGALSSAEISLGNEDGEYFMHTLRIGA